MNDKEINQAIAEAMGWRDGGEKWVSPTGDYYYLLPHYTADLNACAEFEASLATDEAVRFRWKLQKNSDGPKAVFRSVEAALCHATARQRCEAFLRVKGLWKKSTKGTA